MGAAGPNHFAELLDGEIAVYNKSGGSPVSHTNMNGFFSVVDGNTTYPTGNPAIMGDPRILYDAASQAWLASAIDQNLPAGHFGRLYQRRQSDKSRYRWIRYVIRLAQPGMVSDFDTLGLDATAFTFRAAHTNNVPATNSGHTVVAIKKSLTFTWDEHLRLSHKQSRF